MMTTILITGASRGIGLEFVRQYAAEDASVIATCRTPEAAQDLQAIAKDFPNNVAIEQLDVTDASSIATLARKYEGQPIDILINNAGVSGPRDPDGQNIHQQFFGSLNYDAWLDVLNANTLGPLRVAEAFIDNVAASGEKKIVTLSSTMGSIVESAMPAFLYSSSKAALNKAIVLMAGAVKERGVIAAAYCPGHVKTDLGGEGATLEPAESVAGLRNLFLDLTMDKAGSYTRYNGETIAW